MYKATGVVTGNHIETKLTELCACRGLDWTSQLNPCSLLCSFLFLFIVN